MKFYHVDPLRQHPHDAPRQAVSVAKPGEPLLEPRASASARIYGSDIISRGVDGLDVAFRAGYNEYVMCMKKTNSDEDACKPMRQLALSICPDDWWGKWDEEREEGTFAGVKMGGGGGH